MGVHVCTCSVCTCVFAQSLHVLAKPWGGIIANFSPRTQSLPPPPIHGSPSIPRKCSGSCGDEMRTDVYHPRWRQHRHQPRPPSPSFNDEHAALACVSASLSPPPRWFICTCLGVFNCSGTFIKSPPLAFRLTCRRTESGDGWWYLALINQIKSPSSSSDMIIQHTSAGLSYWSSYWLYQWHIIFRLHAQTCAIPSEFHWCWDEPLNKLKVWKATVQTGELHFQFGSCFRICWVTVFIC